MKALVVYESFWGNTARIARAIAEGLGEGTRAVPTDEATGDALDGVDLLVVGAPVLGFSLPTDSMRENLRRDPGRAPSPPDLSHPSMREWLAALPKGDVRFATFETRIWWSPRGATGTIEKDLLAAGYRRLAKRERFIVTGGYGPLKEGEVERAQAWGATLARAAVREPR
jgi:hypothetical protein